ncbi:SAM-dependent methyltransferase [Streptomyces aculeolatus]|uniref:SAM-dependent methyltransferase n=1 Tax=Streptomyces aculeolatus TaxID=270689 RepID=UPI001CED3154|nr:SAM-dependent methyltransferase [Streptomyces aculeolatus]
MTVDESSAGREGRMPLPDARKPHPSRFWDYALGGRDNVHADRDLLEEAERIMPDLKVLTREQRLFVDRTVEYWVGEAGVRQILDIGGGMPTDIYDNVHEVAHRIAPDTRVVYVDKNPVAVAHMAALQADGEYTVALEGDVRDPDTVLFNEVVRSTLDFTMPVGVLLSGILHFITDEEDPAAIVNRIHEAVVPGSYLGINHISSDIDPRVPDVIEIFRRASDPLIDRDRAALERMLDGWTPVEPGLVPVSHWRPAGEVRNACDAYGAVLRKA